MYWFMWMRQGSNGKDFTSELWNEGLVGISFGTWTIDHVQDDFGGIDESKVTLDWLKDYSPKGEPLFRKAWFDATRRFLIGMSSGHRVVVEFDNSLHIATVTDEFKPDPNPSLRAHGEHFKCRRIQKPENSSFPLERLPSSYRLLSTTSRGTVQKIKAYEPLVKLLDQCSSPEEVTEYCRKMSSEQILEILSPKQWETICAEYLRATQGVRPLLLAVGSTLKNIDIYGVNDNGRRVLAQCQNDAKAYNAQSVIKWVKSLAKDSTDIVYFCARKGVHGRVPEDECKVIDDKEILRWLQSEEDYQRHLKAL